MNNHKISLRTQSWRTDFAVISNDGAKLIQSFLDELPDGEINAKDLINIGVLLKSIGTAIYDEEAEKNRIKKSDVIIKKAYIEKIIKESEYSTSEY